MMALGRAGVPPEGRFFPDTYTYARQPTWPCLRRALHAMDRRLADAWSHAGGQYSAQIRR
jgi:UPF0755 protein